MLSSTKWKASTPTTNTNFGAQSHGLCTRCLRFAGWITPPPRKTCFRMAGQPCPGGNDYPLGPTERFQVSPSSFPRLRLAHPFLSIEITEKASNLIIPRWTHLRYASTELFTRVNSRSWNGRRYSAVGLKRVLTKHASESRNSRAVHFRRAYRFWLRIVVSRLRCNSRSTLWSLIGFAAL